MSSSNQTPAYLRYLTARLQPLGKPGFWLSSVGLMLLLIVAWDAWKDPERFSSLVSRLVVKIKESSSPLNLSSDELAARLVDIDNSSVLMEEFGTPTGSPIEDLTNQNSKITSSDVSLTQFKLDLKNLQPNKSEEKSTSPIYTPDSQQNKNTSSNPFAVSREPSLSSNTTSPLLGASTLTNSNLTSSNSSSSRVGINSGLNPLNFNSFTNTSSNQEEKEAPESPLVKALEKVNASNSSASTDQTTTNNSPQANQEIPATVGNQPANFLNRGTNNNALSPSTSTNLGNQGLRTPIYQRQNNLPVTTNSNPSAITSTTQVNTNLPSASGQQVRDASSATSVTPLTPTGRVPFGRSPQGRNSQTGGVTNTGSNSSLGSPGLQSTTPGNMGLQTGQSN